MLIHSISIANYKCVCWPPHLSHILVSIHGKVFLRSKTQQSLASATSLSRDTHGTSAKVMQTGRKSPDPSSAHRSYVRLVNHLWRGQANPDQLAGICRGKGLVNAEVMSLKLWTIIRAYHSSGESELFWVDREPRRVASQKTRSTPKLLIRWARWRVGWVLMGDVRRGFTWESTLTLQSGR